MLTSKPHQDRSTWKILLPMMEELVFPKVVFESKTTTTTILSSFAFPCLGVTWVDRTVDSWRRVDNNVAASEDIPCDEGGDDDENDENGGQEVGVHSHWSSDLW